MIKHMTANDNFDSEIKEGLVLVDFFATWCGPCSMLSPVIEELDKEMDIKVLKIDTDELGELATRFRVRSIPTLLLFKDGKLVNNAMGYMPLNHLRAFVLQK